MKVCIISSKECWQDSSGSWFSKGGFPLQMKAIVSLFDEATLLVVQGLSEAGGIPLPTGAQVIPIQQPVGTDTRRKLSIIAHLPYYLKTIVSQVRVADVIHVPLPGDLPFLGLIIALVMRKHLIARYGGSWKTNSETTIMNRVTKLLMRLFAGGRNVMLATGLGSKPPAPNVHWLFVTAISKDELTSVHPDFERGVNNPFRLAYVGRLSPEKGLTDLLRALGLLNRGGSVVKSSFNLTLIGDGPQRLELASLVQSEGLEECVRFTGNLNRKELIQQLSETDICILPSLTEGFCKARLDAMMCGVPIITTEVGFGRNIVGQDGERGWLVPARNPQALAGTLQQLLVSPPDWPELRKRCRNYVERLSLEAWAQEIWQICSVQWNFQMIGGSLQI